MDILKLQKKKDTKLRGIISRKSEKDIHVQCNSQKRKNKRQALVDYTQKTKDWTYVLRNGVFGSCSRDIVRVIVVSLIVEMWHSMYVQYGNTCTSIALIMGNVGRISKGCDD